MFILRDYGMGDIYIYMIVALTLLAIADLIVGVSNDAVNFLNSAIGSKAVSFRTIMVVASIGVACGALFSSGMMEVARKGIFNPGAFYFNEIMVIFMAVMITDIILLDFFNSLGMPTSTTVSIVFELFGAAVCMALIKIYSADDSISTIFNYINTKQATTIILGIFLSVLVAFTIGAIVQFITRVLVTFKYKEKAPWVSFVFGGIALAAITYFILIKGLKGTEFSHKVIKTIYEGDTSTMLAALNDFFNSSYNSMEALLKGKKGLINITTNANSSTVGLTIRGLLEQYLLLIAFVSFLIWTAISALLTTVLKQNIYQVVIIVGTFALALAFAGNDLVNFIGVPIAALQSYDYWIASGVAADALPMDGLAGKVETNPLFLFLAGLIMVLTLWFSKKARRVIKTSIDLSRQDEGDERFEPNFVSRYLVRSAINMNKTFIRILSKEKHQELNKKFEKPVLAVSKIKQEELPAFDMVRAAINLVVASILISIATSYKLPLSTTYVTFMVAMGTSLADRAWGAESAVYRVAGVLNVIAGWFFTALIAFIVSAIFACFIYYGGMLAIGVLLLVAITLLTKNYVSHTKKAKEEKTESKLKKATSTTINGIIDESSQNISEFLTRSTSVYKNAVEGLAIQDLSKLKKSRKTVDKLNNEIDELRDNIFYFIKSLDDTNIGASKFYINILDHLQNMAQSLDNVARSGYKHVNNNHKKLRFNQIKELKEVEQQIQTLFSKVKETFDNKDYSNILDLIDEKQLLINDVSNRIEKQVERTRGDESSPKNTALFFKLLLETKELVTVSMELLELYYSQSKKEI